MLPPSDSRGCECILCELKREEESPEVEEKNLVSCLIVCEVGVDGTTAVEAVEGWE